MNEPLNITPKQPEIQLPLTEKKILDALESNLNAKNWEEITRITADNPRELFCWAAITIAKIESTKLVTIEDKMTAYAYARTGYHRGLDTLRANDWFGSGYIRSSWSGNRGFLTCLALLSFLAIQIGEIGEANRCLEFLDLLDPTNVIEVSGLEDAVNFLFSNI